MAKYHQFYMEIRAKLCWPIYALTL
jgi:hypothetical protein